MNTKTIQTRNISTSVLEKAEGQAITDGLSSVQDAIRMFLTRYSRGEIQIGFNYEISKNKELEYLNESKKIKSFKKTKDLLKDLKNGKITN